MALAASLAAPLVFAALPATAEFKAGEYTISFYAGPSHTFTNSHCLSFTRTGDIVGFRDSGTWLALTYSGWGGDYVVDNNHLRFYSTYSRGAGVINGYVKISTTAGGFDSWEAGAPPPTPINEGEITLTAGCADSLKMRRKTTGDPTR